MQSVRINLVFFFLFFPFLRCRLLSSFRSFRAFSHLLACPRAHSSTGARNLPMNSCHREETGREGSETDGRHSKKKKERKRHIDAAKRQERTTGCTQTQQITAGFACVALKCHICCSQLWVYSNAPLSFFCRKPGPPTCWTFTETWRRDEEKEGTGREREEENKG